MFGGYNISDCIVISNCSEIEPDTCEFLAPSGPLLDEEDLFAGNDSIYDEDGCFDRQRYYLPSRTRPYEKFIKFVSISILVCGSVGLIGNLISISILSRKEMKNCFNHILIALNICDSIHIVFSGMETCNNTFRLYPTFLLNIFPIFHYPLYRMSLCASIFLLIGIAIERYLAVCRPHHYHSVQDQQHRSLFYILPSLLAALIINIPRFLDTEVVYKCTDISDCGCGVIHWPEVQLTPLRKQWEYQIIYHTWIWNTITGMLPLLGLLYLNTNIYNSMKKIKRNLGKARPNRNGNEETMKKKIRQQNKDVSLAVILIFTILMFLLCHLPRIVSSCVEAYAITYTLNCEAKNKGFLGIWYLYIQHMVQLLMCVNSSVNFPIYLACSTQFRNTFTLYLQKIVKSCHNNTPATVGSLVDLNEAQQQQNTTM